MTNDFSDPRRPGEQSVGEMLENAGGVLESTSALDIIIKLLDWLEQCHRDSKLLGGFSVDDILVSERGVRALPCTQPQKGFIPPECERRRPRRVPQSDVYSAGCCCYRMLSGKTPPDALERSEHDYLLSFDTRGIELPDGVQSAVMRAMNPKIENRFDTAKGFAAALRRCCEEPELTAQAVENKKRLVLRQTENTFSDAPIAHGSEAAVRSVSERGSRGRAKEKRADRTRNIILALCVLLSMFLLVAGLLRLMTR